MMRTLDASRGQLLWRVEAPTSLPFAFSGARIAATFAPIAAVFGEWAGAELRPRRPDPARQRATGDRAGVRRAPLCSSPSRSPSSACWPSQSAASSLGDRKQGMKFPRLPAIAAAVALIALALGLAACGEKSEDTTGAETEPLSLTLDFYPNPDHAGIYMAQKLGYFADAGLDVSIQTPVRPGGADQAGRRRTDRPGDLL